MVNENIESLVPKMLPNLSINEVNEEWVVWDESKGCFHLLNVTARLVLEACDGSQNVVTIAELLAQKNQDISLETVINDVKELVSDFYEKGIVIDSA